MAKGKEKMEALVPVEEQPYPVPANWRWVRIFRLCTLKNGRAFKPTEWSDTGLPIIRIQNLNNPDSEYNFFQGEVSEDHRLYGGELLFAWSGTPGTSFGAHIWNGKDAVLNQHIFRVDFDESILNKTFFKYAINQQLERLISSAHGGAGLQHVTKGVFESTPISIPSINEQYRIVARIESLFAKLDEAKEKAQAVVDGYENRKAAILHKAFTGELTEKWRQENNISKNTWNVLTLKDSGKWMGGGTPSMAHKEYWQDGTILWITSKDMKTSEINSTMLCTNMLGINNSSAKFSNEPSVLFVMRSGILRRTLPIAMVKKPFCINQDLKAVAPVGIEIEYMYWVCENYKRDILKSCMKSGTTVESINSDALMTYKIPVASKEEQKEIIDIITRMVIKEEKAVEAAELLIDQIESMKKSILAKAFRGELGTNDPSEEPVAL